MAALRALLVLAMAIGSFAEELTDEEYYRLPRLFHLDDYDKCMSQREGLFCVGDFDLAPLSDRSDTYDKLKAYSENPLHFNRTVLYRGYCVNARCPDMSDELNTTSRFERCVSRYSRPHDLRVTLRSLKYCKKSHDSKAYPPPDVPMLIFLAIVMLLVAANVIGTFYDIFTGETKKNAILASWSLRLNWHRLTTSCDDGDPRLKDLKPLQGFRVIVLILVILVHAAIAQCSLYINNPRNVEILGRHPVVIMMQNGTALVQTFMVMSSFLLSYNLLIYAEKKPLNMSMLLPCVINRFFRITPVYMLMVSFAATWWPRTNSGPLWEPVVGAESAVCRRKFWWHLLYLQNLVEPQDHCLLQTWFLAADMQLYIVMCVLTLALARYRRIALPVLFSLYVVSSLTNAYLAYKLNWKAFLTISTPEAMRSWMVKQPTFVQLYISPWGSAPAAFMGLLLAHVHYELQQAGFKPEQHKWLRVACSVSIPGFVSWALSGWWLQAAQAPWLFRLNVSVERPLYAVLTFFLFYGFFNKIGYTWRRVLAWRGWAAGARVSLAVLMLHWCINFNIVAGRPLLQHSTLFSGISDTIVVAVCSYLLAVPLTLMVEMPFLRTMNAIIAKPK